MCSLFSAARPRTTLSADCKTFRPAVILMPTIMQRLCKRFRRLKGRFYSRILMIMNILCVSNNTEKRSGLLLRINTFGLDGCPPIEGKHHDQSSDGGTVFPPLTPQRFMDEKKKSVFNHISMAEG